MRVAVEQDLQQVKVCEQNDSCACPLHRALSVQEKASTSENQIPVCALEEDKQKQVKFAISIKAIDLQASKVYEEVLQRKNLSYYRDQDGNFQLGNSEKVAEMHVPRKLSVETLDGIQLSSG